MIRKLKKKFVLINMILVSIVIFGIFFVISLATCWRFWSGSNHSLELILSLDEKSLPFRKEIGYPPKEDSRHWEFSSTSFLVKLSDDKKIGKVIGDNIEISDKVLNEVVTACLKKTKTSGYLFHYQLRYMIKVTNNSINIAFYDFSNELHSLTTVFKCLLLTGLVSLTIFFLISLFLAKWALKPTETSWEQQKQFIADASHELKTPLTVILANTDILLTHKNDTIENQIKWLDYIKTESLRMSTLVNDLLFLAKADTTKEKIIFSKVNISDIVFHCYLLFESVVFEQNKFLDNYIQPDLSMKGDEGKLKQLILILLDNACKYTNENGKILVSIYQKQDKIYLKIINSGDVISPEHLPHLFERFYRSDESRSREQGGYGLGLSIAKTIVELHHGKLSVVSNERDGTIFTIILKGET